MRAHNVARTSSCLRSAHGRARSQTCNHGDMRMRKSKGRLALLLIDFFHPDSYRGLGPIGAATLRAAVKTAALRKQARARQIPVIYVNDNFGDWATDFHTLVARCAAQS